MTYLKKTQASLLSLLCLISLVAFLPSFSSAAEHTFSVDCKVKWYATKDGTAVADQFTVDRASMTGYVGHLEATGEKCNTYFAAYSSKRTPAVKNDPKNSYSMDCAPIASQDIPLDYSGLDSYKIVTMSLGLFNSADLCKKGTPKIATLTLTATMTGTAPTGTTADSKIETIKNPIESESFISLAFSVMKYLLGAIAGIAVVFIMFGGIELMISRGNQEIVTRGKETILWAVIGLAISLFSFSIIAMLQNLLASYFNAK